MPARRVLAVVLLGACAAAPAAAEVACDPTYAVCAFDQTSGSTTCQARDEYGTSVTGVHAYRSGASAGAAGWTQCAHDGRRTETRAVGAAAGYGATGVEARWQDTKGDAGSGRFVRAGATAPVAGDVHVEWTLWEGVCWTHAKALGLSEHPGCPHGVPPPAPPVLPWGRFTQG